MRCCILIPTYNNSATIEKVLNDVLAYTDDVCVVNNGSIDNLSAEQAGTLEILSKFPQIKLYSYQKNVGKGLALREVLRLRLLQRFLRGRLLMRWLSGRRKFLCNKFYSYLNASTGSSSDARIAG